MDRSGCMHSPPSPSLWREGERRERESKVHSRQGERERKKFSSSSPNKNHLSGDALILLTHTLRKFNFAALLVSESRDTLVDRYNRAAFALRILTEAYHACLAALVTLHNKYMR